MARTFSNLIILFSVIFVVKCSKLNVPRVLLPIFNDFPTKFVLEATEGGCYKWTTTRSDIVQLTLLDEDKTLQCSSRVVVSTVTKEAARNIAVVLAEDVHTKRNLRCDVIVDVIDSLVVTTTTKELFMEEAPEDFEVKAYDDQGNEFSSLEGVEFDWNIIPLGPNKESVIRYIAYRDSPYETPSAIEALENENKKGYSILLEGVKSGSAKVTVRLPYSEYKHVATSEVQLMIVANLLLSPAEVYIMVGDVVQFKIYHINNGKMDEIILPDSQYYIEPENADIAEGHKKSGALTGLKEGKTRIVLRDRNVGKNDPMLKLPSATLHVVQPEYIVLNILPHKNWAILVAQHHDIVAEVYDATDHRLYLGENVQLNLGITPEFYTSAISKNESWLTGYGVKAGVALVQASLETTAGGKSKLTTPISAKADLMIYSPITIEPSEVILPWDPITRPKYDIDLIAKGGDGRFLWSSSDNAIGIVSQTGHVRTHSSGFFEVSASMMRNHHNRQSAKFIILPPTRLEIVEFVMEAEVGSPIFLHIALYAEENKPDGTKTLVPFTKCQELPFQVKQSDIKFKQNKTAVLPPVGISCGNIAMVGLNVGTSKVTVTYYQDGLALEDSVTVSAFRALQLLQPKKDVVLAVGSSINLVFTGGPRPVIGRGNEHQKVVVSEDENIARGHDITQFHSVQGEDVTVIEVLCHKLGETNIKLMISNSPTSANCQGQTSTVITRIVCGKPRKILLQPELLITDTSNCPMDLSSGNVVVQSNKIIDIDVILYDDCGNKFLNFSSLHLDWKVIQFNAGILLSKDGVFPKNITLGTVAVADKSYQSFMPHLDIGPVVINVTVIGYNKAILNKNKIKPEWPEFTGPEDKDVEPETITATLALYLVEDTALADTSITVFNHPGNKKKVSVIQGSGYFEIALSADDIVDVRYLENTKELEITPHKSGEVIVQLLDLCLLSKPATLTVNVVSVGIIRVEMTDKVEIGKCIPCSVRMFDENDNLMDIPDMNMVDLRPEFEDKIANIQRAEKDPKKPWGPGEIEYIVTGIETGDTKLIFTASSNDEDVNSAPMNLQVFQPLKVQPRNSTLLILSTIQLVIKGGPQPDTEIIFTVANNNTAKVTDKGLITGLSSGTTKINVQAIGVHPTTGQSLIYSEDSVEVTVIPLQGVKILAPLTRFSVGTTVPFWCFGIPDISPVILGTIMDPPIQFRWQVDDKLLADLTGAFYPLGINIGRIDRIVLKLTGLQSGSTRVFVNVTVPGVVANLPKLSNVVYSSFIDIEIVDQFILTNPKNVYGAPFLIAPFSQIQLTTNLDSVTNIQYGLPGHQVPSTELLVEEAVYSPNDDVVDLSPTGLLKSFGTLGTALITITSTDSNGLKQKIHIVVEVKPIHYMTVDIIANWRISFNSPAAFVPLGTEFLLVPTYHDNIGNIFQAGPIDVKIRTSRCDLLKVTPFPENGTILISTKKEGQTMVKLWTDGMQKVADYISIHVQQLVRPLLEHLTAGDTVCLWSPVFTEYNTPGTWKSSDQALMEINPALDIGFVGNKVGTVTLTHSLMPSAPIHVTIYPVMFIEFFVQKIFILTNGERDSVTRFVVVLQSKKSVGNKSNNLIQGWRCRTDVRKLVKPQGFKCFMQFSNDSSDVRAEEIFNVTNSWVPETGQYACKLINLNDNSGKIAVLKTNVSIWAVTDDGNVESEKIQIKFLPGIFVENEVALQEGSNNGEMIIKGLPEVLRQVTVSPADSAILMLSEQKPSVDTEKGYLVQLLDYHWRLADMSDAMGIIIDSPLTKQNLRVIVKVTGDIKGMATCGMAKSPLFTFLQNYKYAMMMAAAMILIFLLTFYFYTTYMQPIVNVNVNPTRSVMTSCAANMSAQNRRCAANMSPLNRTSPNIQNMSPGSCKFNCSCAKHGAREPIYGDPSSFYTNTPDIRRNRKFM